MNISIEHLWASMGWFARGIVILLVFLSAMSMQVAIRKLLQLGAAERDNRKFVPAITAALEHGDFLAAAQAVEAHRHSHLARLMQSVFPAWQKRATGCAAGEAIAPVERTLEINQMSQIGEFRRGLGTLATVGSTAPFVGLLGTVMGIVNAFVGMSQSSASGLEAVSAGIAEALVTTAFGLVVAIPSVWLYNYFLGRIESMTLEMGHSTLEVIDHLLRSEEASHDAGIEERHAAAGA